LTIKVISTRAAEQSVVATTPYKQIVAAIYNIDAATGNDPTVVGALK